MEIERALKLFKDKPYLLRMGANKLSTMYGISPENFNKARLLRHKELRGFKTDIKIPKILILDIETSPLKAYVWKRWKENISLDKTISEWFMLAWSAKWLYSTETMGDVLSPTEVSYENDNRIVTNLWKLLDKAEIVIAHNGDQFDLPRINSRFLVNGLMPPSSYRQIDTLKVAKYQFGFSSNKLDALAGYFGLEHKLSTTFELWKNCMEGDEESLDYMLEYNKRDVEVLEEVYLKLRPYIKGHPNLGVYIDSKEPICTSCGYTHLIKEDKYFYTNTSKYQLYRCDNCGTISRGRINLLDKDKRKSLITSIPK